jgi:hypothetical protein
MVVPTAGATEEKLAESIEPPFDRPIRRASPEFEIPKRSPL